MATKTSISADMEKAFAEAVAADAFCSLGQIIRDHEAGSVIKDKVDAVTVYSSAQISRVLKAFDLVVSSNMVNTHRKGACRCKS